MIARGSVGDRAGGADPAALDFATRVAGISHVSPHLHEDLGQTEDIGVEVELDGRRLSRPVHAARALADVS